MDGTWTAAGVRRQRPRPRLPEDGLRCAEGGRLRAQGRHAWSAPDGKPLAFEILLNGKDERAGRRRLPAHAGEARHRRHHPLRRRAAVPAAAAASTISTPCLQTYTSSLSPGIEQVGRWGSASRDSRRLVQLCRRRRPGGRRDDRGDAQGARAARISSTAVRAYDRRADLAAPMSCRSIYQPEQWIARWTRIEHPETTPLYGYQLPTWWREDELSAGRTAR